MNNIRHYRNKRRYKPEELAEMAETSYAYICQLERGERAPNVYLAIKIAKALKVKVETLFQEADQ